jgi:hypothetical protein
MLTTQFIQIIERSPQLVFQTTTNSLDSSTISAVTHSKDQRKILQTIWQATMTKPKFFEFFAPLSV